MESLGLIEAIIATVADSPNYLFSKNKAIVNTEQLLDMLEKLKVIIQQGGGVAQNNVTVDPENDIKNKSVAETNPELFGLEGEALLRQAKEEAEKMRANADRYAENVLSNLQIVVSKMLRNIDSGKERLKTYKDK